MNKDVSGGLDLADDRGHNLVGLWSHDGNGGWLLDGVGGGNWLSAQNRAANNSNGLRALGNGVSKVAPLTLRLDDGRIQGCGSENGVCACSGHEGDENEGGLHVGVWMDLLY